MIKNVLITLAATLFVNCGGNSDDIDCSTLSDPEAGIELVYPRGTESFEYGETVPVKWKVDPAKVTSVVVQVSKSNTSGFKNILQASIPTTGDGSDIRCMDTLWEIGSEWDNFTYDGSSVYIRVAKYNDEETYQSVSGMITVKQP